MASNPKRLRIVAAREEGPSTRVLTIVDIEGRFERLGGKYVIVHTGLVASGKAIKRAYSLMPSARVAGAAEIAVKRLGIGSRALHDAAVGTEFTFSGPWGKLIPEEGLAPKTLLVATDTGITSALGVVEDAGSRSPELTVLWLRANGESFLDASRVQ